MKSLLMIVMTLMTVTTYAKDANLVFTPIVEDMKTNAVLNVGNIEQYVNDRCIIRIVATSYSRRSVMGDPTAFITRAFPSYSQITTEGGTILRAVDDKKKPIYFYVGMENLRQFEASNSLRLESACWE